MNPVPPAFEQILGIRFINADAATAVDYLQKIGGYLVVPAAPALANIERDPAYARALIAADLAIADSGFMVLLWRILRGRKVQRVSGLRYLLDLVGRDEARRNGQLFLILPNEAAREKAVTWFRERDFTLAPADCYVAPIYGDRVDDRELVERLNEMRPANIVVGIGGGTQEKLGHYLRDSISYPAAIHCLGAALGFLTGDQRPIPMWADRFYLGWFLRLIRQPKLYARRFSRAFALPRLIARYGPDAPPIPPLM